MKTSNSLSLRRGNIYRYWLFHVESYSTDKRHIHTNQKKTKYRQEQLARKSSHFLNIYTCLRLFLFYPIARYISFLKNQKSVSTLALLTQFYNEIFESTAYSKVGYYLNSGKPTEEVSSYIPINFLPIISKLFQKLFLTTLKSLLHELNITSEH